MFGEIVTLIPFIAIRKLVNITIEFSEILILSTKKIIIILVQL